LLFVWGETANYGAFLDAGIDDTEKPTFWAILSRVPQSGWIAVERKAVHVSSCLEVFQCQIFNVLPVLLQLGDTC
jgi:hypothetical protein